MTSGSWGRISKSVPLTYPRAEVRERLIVRDASFLLQVIQSPAILGEAVLIIGDHPGQKLFFFNRQLFGFGRLGLATPTACPRYAV